MLFEHELSVQQILFDYKSKILKGVKLYFEEFGTIGLLNSLTSTEAAEYKSIA